MHLSPWIHMRYYRSLALGFAAFWAVPCHAQDSSPSSDRRHLAMILEVRPTFTYWRARDNSAYRFRGGLEIQGGIVLGSSLRLPVRGPWAATVGGSWSRSTIDGQLRAILPGFGGVSFSTWDYPSATIEQLNLTAGVERRSQALGTETTLEAAAGVGRFASDVVGEKQSVVQPVLLLGVRAAGRDRLSRGAFGIRFHATRSSKDLAEHPLLDQGAGGSAATAFRIQTHDTYTSWTTTAYVRWSVW